MRKLGKISIREFRQGDEFQIKWLHYHTVREVNGEDYTGEQIESWSPKNVSPRRWFLELSKSFAYVATEEGGGIVGFGDIDSRGKIKRLYVDKDAQGVGVGTMLLEELEVKARDVGRNCVSLDSTITARKFYESHGYVFLEEIVNVFGGVSRKCLKMRKDLK